MTITVKNHVARVVFSAESTISFVDRGNGIIIELGKKGNVVAAQYRSKEGALYLVSILSTSYNFILSASDKSAILNTQF